MEKIRNISITIIILVVLAGTSYADDKMMGISSLPKEKQTKIAESAAPISISKDASIMVFGADGKLVEAKKGTNGFTCIPDVDGQEIPDPICADQASMQWIDALMKGEPKPSNTVPGIAYMAMGGWHWEKDGKIVMNPKVPGGKRIKEPPHWMVFWPIDSKMSGIPSIPNEFGTYIMFEGSPFAHLMIYQDPNKLK